MNNCTYNLRRGNQQYQAIVDRITDRLNMSHIEVFEADTQNACATLFKNGGNDSGKPIISYNPSFIQHVQAANPWAMYFIFAHEVAHHYNHDLHGAFLSNLYGFDRRSHKNELNA